MLTFAVCSYQVVAIEALHQHFRARVEMILELAEITSDGFWAAKRTAIELEKHTAQNVYRQILVSHLLFAENALKLGLCQ